MQSILQGIYDGFQRIAAGDPELLSVLFLTLQVSGLATLVSLIFGISCGVILALTRFPGRHIIVSLVNTGMGLPPVVVGLLLAMLLWRNGPLGIFELMYTPGAMVIAQALLATPIVMGISMAAIQQLPKKLHLQILGLGATRLQAVWSLVKEAKLPLLAAVMAGFGGAISEVGASMMVGGNIRGHTRVLTTATAMETSMGHLDIATGFGLILLVTTFLVNLVVTAVQQRGSQDDRA